MCIYFYPGLDQGIPNILELVRGAGKREQSIDWRLAYMELQAITEQARNSIPLPSRLAFQGKNSDSIYLDLFGIGRVETYD